MSSFLPNLSSSRKKQINRKPPVTIPSSNHVSRDQREFLNRIFDQYRGSLSLVAFSYDVDTASVDDIMNIEGTIRYFMAIGLDPEEPAVLALAYKLEAPSLGVFNRHGFVEGWRALGYVSLLNVDMF